jgi:nitrogen regulatory protein P-II 1
MCINLPSQHDFATPFHDTHSATGVVFSICRHKSCGLGRKTQDRGNSDATLAYVEAEPLADTADTAEPADVAFVKVNRHGMTVCEVRGFGRQNRHTETYRGSKYVVDFLPKIKIDVVVVDQNLEQAVKVIVQTAKTGKIGEDKVLISNVEEALMPSSA